MLAQAKKRERSSNHARNVTWRLFWITLLLIHAGAVPLAVRRLLGPSEPTVALTFDVYALFRFGGLVLTALLCLLKSFDVRFLRLPRGWRATSAVAIVVALLHAGVIGRAQKGDVAFDPTQVSVVLAFGAGLNLPVSRASVRVLISELRAAHDRDAADRPPCGAAFAPCSARGPTDIGSLASPFAPRPPPGFARSLMS